MGCDKLAGIDEGDEGKERDMTAGTRLLERLTASEPFLLLWDHYGWSIDIALDPQTHRRTAM